MKIAILDDYLGCARTSADWSAVERQAELTVFTEPLRGADETIRRLADFDVLCLMRDRTPLPASTLAALPKLRFITFTGARNATLDMDAAKSRGIVVTRTGGGLNQSTTELVWALLMATVRQLPANEASLRAGRWQATLGPVLTGKTLGIIGLGRIGSKIASYAQAFEMNVLAWSRSLTAEAATAAGATPASRDELLRESDVVSLHVPLSDSARGLIGARELDLMKPTAYLINTSRGPLVDTGALIEALRSGSIAGAGLDVYDHEPVAADDRLVAAPNLVLLPHLGFVSQENMAIYYQESIENIEAWLAGAPIRTV